MAECCGGEDEPLWQPGGVVGCGIVVEPDGSGEVTYYYDGKLRWKQQIRAPLLRGGVVPAISLHSNLRVRVNMGDEQADWHTYLLDYAAPPTVYALGFIKGDRKGVLLVNKQPAPQRVALASTGGAVVTGSAQVVEVGGPEPGWNPPATRRIEAGSGALTLGPFGVAVVDVE